jgi:hypothetical protein
MELVGSEKRIQALFSELSLEDQSSVPQFGHLWSRAQVAKETEVRSFGRPVAILVSIVVTVTACSFAVWSWYTLTAAPTLNTARHPKEEIVEAPYIPNPVKLAPVFQPEKVQPRRHNSIVHRRQADRRIANEAAVLSSWQSPTQSFMASPTGVILGSLPQLNQSVKDLESFLSKNNEIMKESNR